MRYCFICNSKNISLKISINQYTLYKCNTCSVVSTFPQDDLRQSELINARKYDSQKEEREYLRHNFRLSKRAILFSQEIKDVKKSGKLLDIGCSYGVFLEVAQKAGFEVTGIEIAKRAVIYVREKLRLPVFHGTLEQAHFNSGEFDVITAYDVVEHIPNIKIFLSEVKRILKKDGIFVVQCPNIESAAAKLLGKNWNWLVIPNHLWHFSPRSLFYLLESIGFKILLYKTWDDVDDLAENLMSNLNSKIIGKKTSLTYKLGKKILVFLIHLASLVWRRLGKGGAIRIYACKV